MSKRAFCLCFLHLILLSLCLAPMALALEKEKSLPESNCPPASGGGGYAAGGSSASPSIQDVWMQQGGARQYYSAQYAPRQQYMGGATRIDPACLPLLPPMRAWGAPEPKKKSYTRRSAAKPAVPCPEVATTATGASAPAASAKGSEAAKDGAAISSGKKPDQVTETKGNSSASLSRAEAIARAKAASDAEAARLARGGKTTAMPKVAPEKVLH